MAKQFVTIFIPTHNDCLDLSACIESIRCLDYPKQSMEILIWDNSSQDNTIQMVRKQFLKMKEEGWSNLSLIEWNKNDGSYIPYNLGLQHMSPRTEFILGLDADVELEPATLLSLIDACKDDQVATVGARSVYYDFPERTAHGAGFVNLWIGSYSEKDTQKGIECDYVIGCCWLLKKAIFEELGRFDPDYYINQWEVDYCLRAKKNGYKIIYEPKAIALHKIPDMGTRNPERLYYLYRNKLLLIEKNATFLQKLTSLTLYTLFWLPKIIRDSFRVNKRINAEEIKVIMKAIYHGIIGRVGKQKI